MRNALAAVVLCLVLAPAACAEECEPTPNPGQQPTQPGPTPTPEGQQQPDPGATGERSPIDLPFHVLPPEVYETGHDLPLAPYSAGGDHSALQNLQGDTHTQYLDRSGARAMTGNLGLGSVLDTVDYRLTCGLWFKWPLLKKDPAPPADDGYMAGRGLDRGCPAEQVVQPYVTAAAIVEPRLEPPGPIFEPSGPDASPIPEGAATQWTLDSEKGIGEFRLRNSRASSSESFLVPDVVIVPEGLSVTWSGSTTPTPATTSGTGAPLDYDPQTLDQLTLSTLPAEQAVQPSVTGTAIVDFAWKSVDLGKTSSWNSSENKLGKLKDVDGIVVFQGSTVDVLVPSVGSGSSVTVSSTFRAVLENTGSNTTTDASVFDKAVISSSRCGVLVIASAGNDGYLGRLPEVSDESLTSANVTVSGLIELPPKRYDAVSYDSAGSRSSPALPQGVLHGPKPPLSVIEDALKGEEYLSRPPGDRPDDSLRLRQLRARLLQEAADELNARWGQSISQVELERAEGSVLRRGRERGILLPGKR